uniref:CCAAT-binding factor domain-containing protein n=1 Tax=Anopheles melas TaxID=34690 RepID=A0A182U3T2_9DIPT
MAIGGGKFKKKSDKKRYFEEQADESATPEPQSSEVQARPAKIVFDDEGEQRVVPIDYTAGETGTSSRATGAGRKKAHANGEDDDHEGDEDEEEDQLTRLWYNNFEPYNLVGEMVDMKDAELAELRNICKVAFEAECRARKRYDPSDAKWLLSALEKGTLRDRANAGALLVQTNPFCHLHALDTLVGMVKPSNKGFLDVVEVLTELMLKSLMPTHRKLITLPMRGTDWKNVQKLQTLEKPIRDQIYAHWHFEDQLREHYFAFVTNLSTILHTGQEPAKLKVIGHVAKLFSNVPELERLLLTALVNKLGDPLRPVASKVLYHLQQIVRRHSAMAFIITGEVEKLLFRNNVAPMAQYYSLSFLAAIGSFGDFPTCQKMINICFSYFKILTEKGEINSRTMQSILTCLRKAIANVKRDVDLAEVVEPGLLDVIYRMIHLADFPIGCQGLSLLLEITERKGYEQDRFYNALYRKLLDPELASIGPRITNVFFYILHRAMQNDPIPERAQAFVKRLLQVAFHFPAARLCGALIVVSKVLRKRKVLLKDGQTPPDDDAVEEVAVEERKEDLDDQEEDVEGKQDVSKQAENKVHRAPTRYDAFRRASEFAGAQYTLRYELVRYRSHFHPTVQKFAESILANSALTYYGDPLQDFSLGRFLDRFAFKNPKKPKTVKDENGDERLRPQIPGVAMRKSDYAPAGFRALPVNALAKDKCAEDDEFILKFLEQKRLRLQRAQERKKAKGGDDEDEDSDVDSLNDDEFDAYLDQLGVPGGTGQDADMDGGNEVDFMQELEQELAKERKGKQSAGKKAAKNDEDDEDGLDDWDYVDDEDDDDDGAEGDDDSDDDRPRKIRRDGDVREDDGEFSDGGSISLEEDEDEDFDMADLDDDNDNDDVGSDDDAVDEPMPKKRKKLSAKSTGMVSQREFARKLKTSDVNSLFAAADDFSELLEGNVDPLGGDGRGAGKKKGGGGMMKKASKRQFEAHGTEAEVFNQDASSMKQLAWEASRFSDHGRGGGKRFGGRGGGAGRTNFQKRGGGGGFGRGRGGGKKFAGGGRGGGRPMGRK